MGEGGNREEGSPEIRGLKVFGKPKKRGQQAGELGNYTTLHTVLQMKKKERAHTQQK